MRAAALLIGLVACAAPAGRTEVATPVSRPAVPAPHVVPRPCTVHDEELDEVLAQVRWWLGSPGQVPLASGDTLRSGDQLALEVEAADGVHVYLLLDGGDLRPITGGAAGLTLDEEAGRERVWVLASREPIADAELVRRQVDAAEAAPRLVLARAAIDAQRDSVALRHQRGVSSAAVAPHEVAIGGAEHGVIRFEFEHVAVVEERKLAFAPAGGAIARARFSQPEELHATGPARITERTIAAELAGGYPAGSAVLLYHHDGDRLDAYLVDCAGLAGHARVAVSEAELDRRIGGLRAAVAGGLDPATARVLARRLEIELDPGSADQAAAALMATLLPAALQEPLTRVRHLVVVPIGGIGSVPFPMLCPFADDSCLVDRMSVSIAPSIFDLFAAPPPWTWGFEDALVVGNPAFEPRQHAVPPLPAAEEEAREVAALLGVEPLVGDRATTEAVLAAMPEAGLIYIATHAIADAERPLDASFLLFAGDESQWLTPRRVQELGLERTFMAQLVVLSACQTGLGGFHRGGVMGISRAFQIGGAPRVVMSQWNIDDRVTKELMVRFMRELPEHPPAEALRRAMVALRVQHPEPMYWAPFLLFGTPR